MSIAYRFSIAEMARKRLEYFHAEVQLIWIVDCANRTIAIYTGLSNVHVIGETATIDGGNVLPGFTSLVADFFVDLDIGRGASER